MTLTHDPSVVVPTAARLDGVFHTAPNCPRAPSDGTPLSRSAARRDGLTECRRCFERRLAGLKREYASRREPTAPGS